MQTARFAHHSLRAFPVILEALVRGDGVAKKLPRGYAKLADQLRRALLGAYLQFTEGAAREGDDRKARLRCARAEAGDNEVAVAIANNFFGWGLMLRLDEPEGLHLAGR